MIRDPSDGSVRKPKAAVGIPATMSAPSLGLPQSGLAPLDKDHANETAKLKRSREWIAEYHRRKACTGQ